MATLVLTTIGGAIGGPIGAMLGGLLGQGVDRELLKPKGREGPRLNELKVQTSSYGAPIPKLFGTLRVAGTVIWATDLVEHRQREGGKGRPTTTSYSYSASFAVALSARPIQGVGRIWADGKLLRGAAGDWKTPTQFRLHLGSEDQAPDPLIAAAEGAGLAPAHRGIAYAVFEDLALADFGNRIPSLTLEVIGDAGPVTTGKIVAAVTDGKVSAGEAVTAIDGFSAYGSSQRAVIEPLVHATGAWPMASDGGMTLAAGDGDVVVVTDWDVRASDGEASHRSIAAADRAPRTVVIGYYDPARDYQAGLQQASRPGAGHRAETIELPAALAAGQAKRLAHMALARAELERDRRTVMAGWQAIGIAPGGSVEIAGEPGKWRVVASRLERMAVSLDLVRVAQAPLPLAATPGRVIGAPDLQAGTTIVHAFELPQLSDDLLVGPRISIAACGTEPGWRRAALMLSADGERWDDIASTAAPAIIGLIETPPVVASADLEDRRSMVVVRLMHGGMALGDADHRALDAGANLALIGSELVQFGTAEPLGGNRWRLTRLWRGRRGSEAAIGTATIGDRFVLIAADSLRQHDVPPGSSSVHVLAAGVNDGAGVTAIAPLTGAALVPPAPTALRARIGPDGSSQLSWIRRSRAGWRWLDHVDAPLGEERERYRLRFLVEGVEIGEAYCEVPAFTVPTGLGDGSPLTIELCQVGDHGLSLPAMLTLSSEE